MRSQPNCIVSIPVHENDLCVVDLCLNYVNVGEAAGVVLHMNPQGSNDPARLANLVSGCPSLRGKVWINPHPMSMPLAKGNASLTGYLYRAHLSNFLYAYSALPDFDVFCHDSSNSLLIQRGWLEQLDVQAILRRTALSPDFAWTWRAEARSDSAALAVFGEPLFISQHEGFYLSRSRYAGIVNDLLLYDFLHRSTPRSTEADYPREELLFSTATDRHLTPSERSSPSRLPHIWMRWERNLEWITHEVAQLLAGEPLPPGRFGIKRIPRDINHPLRVMIGEHFGYRKELADAMAQLR